MRKRDPEVACGVPECGEPATYKIAAPWSDGRYSELKTYGFACNVHVRAVLGDAEARWLDYEPVKGEMVQDIGIFHFEPGKGDRNLARDQELEEQLGP